ncbi:hypothetical protein FS837_010724 [Tulasnella sp. UAMH 9824]|nr:hypothetical protein FS837_010724 [Tulasnella sp. UAMH 9824]
MSPNSSSALEHQQSKNVPSRPQTTALDLRTATSNVLNRSSPYYRLPPELLAFILTLRFTDTDGLPKGFEITELYRLRLVSKLWKELIEGAPTLWTYISSDYPTVVIQDCVRWSKNHLLQIRVPPILSTSVEALIEVLQLLQLHSHRWKTLEYCPNNRRWIDTIRSRHFLESPAPMLQSINVNLEEFGEFEPPVNLAGGMAKGLRHVTLKHAILPEYSNFVHGLETFSLRNMNRNEVQMGEILNIFVKNPALRRFELHCNGAEEETNPTTSPAHPSNPVANALEEVVFTVTHPRIISHILSQVSMPNCKSLKALADCGEWDGDLPGHIQDEMLAQFMPRVREALSLGGRTRLLVQPGLECGWRSSTEYEGFQFAFDWSTVTLESVIAWIRGLCGALESPLELEIVLSTENWETLETLAGWKEVTKLTFLDLGYNEYKEVPLPSFLGDFLADPNGGLSWNLPNLRELDVYDARYNLSRVFGILNRRYLPDACVKEMEGLGITIQAPPRIDLRVRGTTDVGDVLLMTALKSHWGVRSLEPGKFNK